MRWLSLIVLLVGCSATHPPGDPTPVEGTLTRTGACQMVLFGFEAKRDGFAAVTDAPCDLDWACPWGYPTTECDPVLVEVCFTEIVNANQCLGLGRALDGCVAEACR